MNEDEEMLRITLVLKRSGQMTIKNHGQEDLEQSIRCTLCAGMLQRALSTFREVLVEPRHE